MFGLAFLSCGAALSTHASPAHACGGCFHGPMSTTTPSVVTGHRMAVAISPTRTVLWDQVQYVGDPKDFAWVLPVGPGATIEQAEPAFFEALEAVSGTHVVSPAVVCNGQTIQSTEGGAGCGAGATPGLAGPSGDTTMQQGTDPNVTVEHEGTVGPYETVTLKSTDPMALRNWLGAHGYNIPADIGPIIDAYVQQGSDFIALRLQPSAGVREMTPVRVITPGASPTFPLRMVAAGTGADVSIVLYVIGEGQYAAQNFAQANIDYTQLAWTWSTESSNYATLRQSALAQNGFLTSFALRQGLSSQVLQPNGKPATFLAGQGQSYSNFADLYFAEASADAVLLAALEGADAGTDAGAMPPCNGFGAAIDAVPQGAEVVDAMGAPPPAGTVDASTFVCNGFGDLATALVGMHPGDVWITRLEADLTRQALAVDLTLGPALSQVAVPSWHLAPTSIGTPCPPNATPPPSSGTCAAGRRPAFADTAAFTLGALGLGLLLRRRGRSRRD
jgi:hypothetical protein